MNIDVTDICILLSGGGGIFELCEFIPLGILKTKYSV